MGLSRKFRLLVVVVSALALGAGEFEPYSARPDALAVKPRSHTDLGPDWEKLKRGHLEAVAQLLELYPDRDIYFLARDSEMLFDLARFASRKDAAALARLHLLNISRINQFDPQLKKYLSEQGMSEEALKAGKKFLLVDTGYRGTIPAAVGQLFDPSLRSQIQTHLIVSRNPAYPSSRTFLVALNPAVNESGPESMHSTVKRYEHLSRFTHRSTRFEKVDGKLEPMSPTQAVLDDGSVSSEQAQKYQEDLLHYIAQEPQVQLLQSRREEWAKLRQIWDRLAQGKKQEVIQILTDRLLKADATDAYTEARVRDLLDAGSKNLIHGNERISVTELGLPLEGMSGQGDNRLLLVKKYPQWGFVLNAPKEGIQSLIQNGDWTTLGAITDVLYDEPFLKDLAQVLGQGPVTLAHKQYVSSLIQKKDPSLMRLLAEYTFSQPSWSDSSEELMLLTELGDSKSLRMLAYNFFSRPHSVTKTQVLRRLIERADSSVLEALNLYALSAPHWNTEEGKIYKEAVKILDSKGRKELFDKKMGGSPLIQNSEQLIQTEFLPGSTFVTAQGRELRVESLVDTGKRGRVYRVKDLKSQQVFALKVAKDAEVETLESLGQEAAKATAYKKLGIAHSEVIEAQPSYVVKTWIDGTRADAWIREWEKLPQGVARDTSELKRLKDLVQKLSAQGTYVGDLNAKNLIWNGIDWIVVDSGSIQEGVTEGYALQRFSENISRRWAKKSANPQVSESCLKQALQSLVSANSAK